MNVLVIIMKYVNKTFSLISVYPDGQSYDVVYQIYFGEQEIGLPFGRKEIGQIVVDWLNDAIIPMLEKKSEEVSNHIESINLKYGKIIAEQTADHEDEVNGLINQIKTLEQDYLELENDFAKLQNDWENTI